jgi:hypothetical protein
MIKIRLVMLGQHFLFGVVADVAAQHQRALSEFF